MERRDFLKLWGAGGGALAVADALPGLCWAQGAPDTLKVAIETDLDSLRPDLWGAISGYTLKRLIYATTLLWGVRKLPNGNLIYDNDSFENLLLESHKVAADGASVEFTLKDGLKFANGDRINAPTMKAAFEWYIDAKAVGNAQLKVNGVSSKEQIEVVNDRTYRLRLDRPVAWSVVGHAVLMLSVIHAGEIRKNATKDDPIGVKWLETKTVESGPYVIDEWKKGSHMSLKPNPNYPVPPRIKRVVLQVIPDQSTRRILLEKGDVHFATLLATKDIPQLKGRPNLTVASYPNPNAYWLGMTWRKEPFTDPAVRRAIAWAVPYDAIMKVVLHELGERLRSPLPKHVDGYTEEFWTYETNLDRARQELAQSKSPKGFEVAVPVSAGDVYEEESTVLIKDALDPLGIKLRIQKMPRAQKSALMSKREVDMAVYRWKPWIADGAYFIHYNYLPDSFANYWGYVNPVAQDAGLATITLKRKSEERTAKFKLFQKTVCADVNVIPLFSPWENVVLPTSLKGYVYYPDDTAHFHRMSLT